VQGQVTDSQFD